MTLYEFIGNKYLPPWIDARSVSGPIYINQRQEYDISTSYCSIAVNVPDKTRDVFMVTLFNVPWDEHVVALADKLNGEWSETPTGRSLEVKLGTRSVTKIRQLAEAVRKVTGRGRRYQDRNWKWVTGRVSDSLNELANHLALYHPAKKAEPRGALSHSR